MAWLFYTKVKIILNFNKKLIQKRNNSFLYSFLQNSNIQLFVKRGYFILRIMNVTNVADELPFADYMVDGSAIEFTGSGL